MSAISIIFTLFFFVFAVLAINILHIFQAKGNKVKALALIVVFAVVFTQSSLFWTKDSTFSWKVVRPLETGWPIHFHYEPHPMNQVWEAPSTNSTNFFYSVLINASLWGAGFFSLSLFFKKIGVAVKPFSFRLVLLWLISLIAVMFGINFINSKMAQLQNPGMNNPVVLPDGVAPTHRPSSARQ